MGMAWPAQKKHLSFFFLFFFFLGVLYLSKHVLQPTLSAYRIDLFLDTRSVSSVFGQSQTDTIPLSGAKHPVLITAPALSANANISSEQSKFQIFFEDGFTDPASNASQGRYFLTENDNRSSSGAGLGSEQTWEKCDIFSGTWVKDESYPLYQPGSCPYVDDAFNCQANGRRDSDYLRWRWKPHGCEIPRFNATDFLERLRGKRMMLVGDSMNRNQFESMLCLLREALPDKSRISETRGYKITKGRGYFIFHFMDYNCTVEFCRSHFLVKEGTRTTLSGHRRPTLLIDRIDKSYNRWRHADILIFNTGHWWAHGKTARGKDYYQEGDFIYPQFDALEAFKRAMRTWGKWLDKNIDPGRKLVFYRGYSTAHFRGGDWDSGGTCNGETQPIFSGDFLDSYHVKMKILEEVIREIQTPVILLNVTKLTNFRKDGHPSIYRSNFVEGRKVSSKKQDCSHWCLPGVPDAWNELIYAYLVTLKARVN